ncbi:hypothetical protein ABKN59_003508 [Abortiporus biennis]
MLESIFGRDDSLRNQGYHNYCWNMKFYRQARLFAGSQLFSYLSLCSVRGKNNPVMVPYRSSVLFPMSNYRISRDMRSSIVWSVYKTHQMRLSLHRWFSGIRVGKIHSRTFWGTQYQIYKL